MTSLYSELGDSSNHFSGLASFLLVGRGSNILLRYENVAQTVMYLLAFIGLIALTRAVFRNRNEEGNADKVFVQVLLCASFLGGFPMLRAVGGQGHLYIAVLPVAGTHGGLWHPNGGGLG